MNRRVFVQNSLISASALAGNSLLAAEKASKNEFAIFTKPFQHLNYSDFMILC